MEIPIIMRTYDLFKFSTDAISRMEKRWRYSIGTSTEKTILDLLDQVIMAKHAPTPLKLALIIKDSQ